MHRLYSTPTLQDITTVEADLKRPLTNFEDFLDHVTDHINNYESLRSFNQQVANITKMQTFKDTLQRWPQFDPIISTWEMDNNNTLTRNFTSFTDYLVSQYGNLPTDVKPRGGNAYNILRKGKKGKRKGNGDKDKGKQSKGKGRGGGRFVYWDEDDVLSPKRQRITHLANSAATELNEDTMGSTPDDSVSVRSHHYGHQRRPRTKYMAPTAQRLSSGARPILNRTSITIVTTMDGIVHTSGPHACCVMLNNSNYLLAQHEATSPVDTTPVGNMNIEPIREDGVQRPFLKAWGRYSN